MNKAYTERTHKHTHRTLVEYHINKVHDIITIIVASICQWWPIRTRVKQIVLYCVCIYGIAKMNDFVFWCGNSTVKSYYSLYFIRIMLRIGNKINCCCCEVRRVASTAFNFDYNIHSYDTAE